MEISQGNSLCSYKQKCHIFFSIFSSTKLENRRAEQVMPRGRGLVEVGGGRERG
jgi:hypothetical protein